MGRKDPPIPPEKGETVRRKIIAALSEATLSAGELSQIAGVSEKDIYSHLSHIRKSIERDENELHVTPSVCRKCGFLFRKRERLTKPGKCPVCRSEYIEEPLFSIRVKGKPDR